MDHTVFNLQFNVSTPAYNQKAKSQAPDKKQTEVTFKKYDYTCRFCSFRSVKYQRVVLYQDLDSGQEWVVSCLMCDLVRTLDRVQIAQGSILIWLPEITQNALNHIVRAIYVARDEGSGKMMETAQKTLELLTNRRTEVKKRIGSDDPSLLATLMSESLSQDDYKKALKKIDGVRLLISDKYVVRVGRTFADQFPKMLHYWKSNEGPFAQLPVDNWTNLFTQLDASVGRA